MREGESIIGIIYPLPRELVKRVNSNRNIFVKYLTHEPNKRSLKIKEEDKLFIYESRNKKMIVAEAIISKIEFLTIDEIFKKYKNRTIAGLEALRIYSKGREEKKMLVLHLNNINMYKEPLPVSKPITMAGQYITKHNWERLIKNSEVGGEDET